jgi:hypothetical protein
MKRWVLVLTLLSTLLVACGQSEGSVAGQVKALQADGSVKTLPGAQIILRGRQDTQTAVTTAADDSASGTAAYNYKIERLKPGPYVMAVSAPAGSNLQGEDDLHIQVESGELYAQSVLLLPVGTTKPRPLSASEVGPGEAGYVNPQGQRVVYQGGGFDMTDAMLMYLLFRSPTAYGYGSPPVIVNNPGGTGAGSWRVDAPPARTDSGTRITQRPSTVPGQGTTRPGSVGNTGAAPTYRPPSGSGTTPSNGTVRTSPAGGPAVSAPSQGVSRPSVSAPSRPSFSGGGRSSGGRK